MVCSSCGTATASDAQHCPNCGTRLGTAAPAHNSNGSSNYVSNAAAGGSISVPMQPGAMLNGRYRIMRVLGTGAFGRVYLAEDGDDPSNPPLAIKELLAMELASPEEQRDAISWFKREVSTLLTLEHPGIPSIHGYWTAHRTAGPLYLAMDFIPGKTLAEILYESGGTLTWQQVVVWGIALCDVLSYLHSRVPPFVFRDVKPANVLIDIRTNKPVLIDFGLARQLVPSGNTAVGTWGYVPFEQVLGKAEARSDLYALGAMLHSLITGRHPDIEYKRLLRTGLDVEGALRAMFPSAISLVPTIPLALSEALGRSTAFAAEDRFSSASAMSQVLRNILELAPGTVPIAQTISTAVPTAVPPAAAPPTQHVPLVMPAPTSPAPAPPTSIITPPPTPTIPGGTPFASAPMPVQPASTAPGPLPLDMSQLPQMPTPESQSLANPSGPIPFSGSSRSIAQTQQGYPPPTSGRNSSPEPASQPKAVHSTARQKGKLGGPTSGSSATTLLVARDGSAQFTSISAAIARAMPGSRIEIQPGRYQESLVLDKPLEIVAVGRLEHTIVESTNAPCILMHTDAAVVQGLQLQCHGQGSKRFYAVNIPEGALLLENCAVYSDGLACIAIHGPSAVPTIRHCIIHNSVERGIVAYEHCGGLVDECDIYGNTLGVRLSAHGNTVFRRCTIHNGKLGGVSATEHGRGTFEDCEIALNAHNGISIMQGSNVTIRRCRVTRNGWVGISVADSSGATVEGCDLTGNTQGSWEIKESARLRVHRRNNTDIG